MLSLARLSELRSQDQYLASRMAENVESAARRPWFRKGTSDEIDKSVL